MEAIEADLFSSWIGQSCKENIGPRSPWDSPIFHSRSFIFIPPITFAHKCIKFLCHNDNRKISEEKNKIFLIEWKYCLEMWLYARILLPVKNRIFKRNYFFLRLNKKVKISLVIVFGKILLFGTFGFLIEKISISPLCWLVANRSIAFDELHSTLKHII